MDVPIFLTKFQEFVVKKSNRVELMAMLGLFGAIVSAIQMYPWELIHQHLQSYSVLSTL